MLSLDIFNLSLELAKLKLSDALFRFVVDDIPAEKGAIVYFLLDYVSALIVSFCFFNSTIYLSILTEICFSCSDNSCLFLLTGSEFCSSVE